jgi:hypothetical protein
MQQAGLIRRYKKSIQRVQSERATRAHQQGIFSHYIEDLSLDKNEDSVDLYGKCN